MAVPPTARASCVSVIAPVPLAVQKEPALAVQVHAAVVMPAGSGSLSVLLAAPNGPVGLDATMV